MVPKDGINRSGVGPNGYFIHQGLCGTIFKSFGAEERTWTSTWLPRHEPESCASTNSATSASSNLLKVCIIKSPQKISSSFTWVGKATPLAPLIKGEDYASPFDQLMVTAQHYRQPPWPPLSRGKYRNYPPPQSPSIQPSSYSSLWKEER